MREISVVLGRNAAGKSALCRLIAGLKTPADGRVTLNGIELRQRDRPVAMVYQAFVNYPNWTVAQNIASPMVAAGRRAPERVRELASLVRIDHLLDRMPHQLSGGQQQRLAIARALAKDPRVLVLDEPFVNIDYKLREELNFELRSLAEITGVCVVFTTSDPRDALTLADQLLLVNNKCVVQMGRPLDLYRYPRSLAAADLLSDPGVNRISSTRFIRPEHIRLTPESDADTLEFRARITGVETNGAETYLHADVRLDAATADWVVKLPGMHRVAAGSDCTLLVRHDDVILVDGVRHG